MDAAGVTLAIRKNTTDVLAVPLENRLQKYRKGRQPT